jgi:hypothetical protein
LHTYSSSLILPSHLITLSPHSSVSKILYFQIPAMQLTILTTLLATALTVSATPIELQEKRQLEGAARVYARFYRDGGCGPSPWAEDTVFLQSDTVGLAGCQDLTVGPFPSTFFDVNNFSRTGT